MMEENNYTRLSPEQLHRWMEAGKQFFLIDTLPSDHFVRVHLPDSKNACVFDVTFIDQVRTITADTHAQIVFYGSSAETLDAPTAAAKMTRAGYGKLFVLEGGLAAWRAAALPLEGEAAEESEDPGTRVVLQEGTYRVDPDRSTIEWIGRNPNSTHFGRVELLRGDLRVKGAGAAGGFEIDMNSITNVNLEGDALQPVLTDHLKSDDFFFSKLFPTARFAIDRAEPLDNSFPTSPNWSIDGTLEMRGVKARQHFLATLTSPSAGEFAAESHFDLDRTQWKITYGSTRFFEHLGMHLVFDLISVQLRIVAVRIDANL